MRLTLFTYANLVMDADSNNLNQIEIDIKLPGCILRRTFTNIELITMSTIALQQLGHLSA